MSLQNLDQRFPIVDPVTGKATDYFLRLLRQNNLGTGSIEEQVAALNATEIIAGAGLDGGGALGGGNVTLELDAVLDDLNDVDTTTTPPTLNQKLGWDGSLWVPQTVSGGGGGAWSLVSSWTFSSPVPFVDFTNLGTYSELYLIGRGLTMSASGVRNVYASVDNGASFYTTMGDYTAISNTGVESNQDIFSTEGGANTTAARTVLLHIPGNIPGVIKTARVTQAVIRTFVASTNVINALRVAASTGNLTGGSIIVMGR